MAKKKTIIDGKLKIYKFEKDTGEYIGDELADPSPLEPGVYLIPASATDIEPPAKRDGYFRKFNGSEWEYEELPKEEAPKEPIHNIAEEARTKRNFLLYVSDWRMFSDTPRKHSAGYKEYRQALRDVPQQIGFPENINWPTEPTNK